MNKDFILQRSEEIREEQATLLHYIHEKTGANVYYMKNADNNKAFSIGFQTLPIGSTGNMHIMEHSVLNGSRNYKTKEPFMDLVKSSLQTFLNAMTYPDKTMYPVSSRNDADFRNLVNLYLDAVFFPSVLEDPRIFRQEGWRREIFEKDAPMTYQGVVYNEMKGAMSSPERQVLQQVTEELYPGTIYDTNSGGDPYQIPTLSYEAFRDYHKEYYHPSNARIFIYGDVNEEEIFNDLDKYLNEFDKQTLRTTPEKVERFDAPKTVTREFSVGEGEPTENKSFFSMSWLVDNARTDIHRYLYNMLGSILVDSESSPLRRRIFEELGAADVFGEVYDVQEVGFMLIAKDVNPDRKDEFAKIVEESLQKMVDEGIARDVWEGVLNGVEFSLREKQGTPNKGIFFATNLLNETFYGQDPYPAFHYEAQLAELREALENGALEKYIQENLLNNPHRVLGVHNPVPGLNAKKDAAVREELAAYKASLSDEELEALIAENQELLARQNEEDTPEQKATIPVLSRDELPRERRKVPRDVRPHGEDTVLFHDMPTAGIHYLDLAFSIDGISAEEAPYAALVTELMGGLDTEKYSYQQYEIQESRHTGGINVSPSILAHDEDGKLLRHILVETKVLGNTHTAELLDLLDQQLFATRWDDMARLKEQIRISYSNAQMGVVQSGHAVASERAMSHIDAVSAFRQKTGGVDYLRFLEKLAMQLTEEDRNKLEAVYRRMFRQPKRIVNLTSHGEEAENFLSDVLGWLDTVETKETPEVAFEFAPSYTSEAFFTNSDVQFNAVAASLAEDAAFDGGFYVLSNILSNALLYNEIRAKGGAYGQFARFFTNGNLMMASYRDPHVRRTYEVYQGISQMLPQLALPEEDLDRFVIGAVGSYDHPMTERQLGQFDLTNFLIGRDAAFYDARLQELLATDNAKLQELGGRVAEAMQKFAMASVGGKEALEREKELFADVERL